LRHRRHSQNVIYMSNRLLTQEFVIPVRPLHPICVECVGDVAIIIYCSTRLRIPVTRRKRVNTPRDDMGHGEHNLPRLSVPGNSRNEGKEIRWVTSRATPARPHRDRHGSMAARARLLSRAVVRVVASSLVAAVGVARGRVCALDSLVCRVLKLSTFRLYALLCWNRGALGVFRGNL
jgi:hypothetical protein